MNRRWWCGDICHATIAAALGRVKLLATLLDFTSRRGWKWAECRLSAVRVRIAESRRIIPST